MANVQLPGAVDGNGMSTEQLIKELLNSYNKLLKEMEFLLSHLDDRNITAQGITADSIRAQTITTNQLSANSVATNNLQAGAVTAGKISVTELSAIVANLGTITAGVLQAVSIISATITGGIVQTTTGSYPRIELRSTTNILKAEQSASQNISIKALDSSTASPLLDFRTIGNFGQISVDPDSFGFAALKDVLIGSAGGKVNIVAPNGVYANGIRLDV